MNYLINWFDIPTLNISRAVKFYSQVFNLKFEILDCGSEKMACFPNINGVSGSLSQVAGFKPSKDGVQITFNGGDDVNDTLNKVVEAGGTIIRGKTKIEVEGRGFFALFADTDGNTIGLYSDN